MLECQVCKVGIPKILQEMMLGYVLKLARLYAQLKAGVYRSRTCGLHTTASICICSQFQFFGVFRKYRVQAIAPEAKQQTLALFGKKSLSASKHWMDCIPLQRSTMSAIVSLTGPCSFCSIATIL